MPPSQAPLAPHEREETQWIRFAVRTEFQKLFPKPNLDRCTAQEKMGKSAYEVTSSEGNTKRDALFDPNGALIVVEEAIEAADLPKAVKRSWHGKVSERHHRSCRKVMRDNTVTYEIQSLWPHGNKPMETVFDDNGKELTNAKSPRHDSYHPAAISPIEPTRPPFLPKATTEEPFTGRDLRGRHTRPAATTRARASI